MDILSQQPKEILLNILSFLSLEDLRRLSHQCSRLRYFIRGNDLLWQQQILRACVHYCMALADKTGANSNRIYTYLAC
jgi:hypothetical protein